MCVNLSAMMSRSERTVNLIGVVVPFVGLIAAVVLLWNQWVDWIDLTIMAVTYLAFGLGITVGVSPLHRQISLPVAGSYAQTGLPLTTN